MSSKGFRGQIGRTVAESVPDWSSDSAAQPDGPNVMVVIFDDVGWSDFACFGSEITTSTVDALARSGIRYRNFHVTPLCSPTRTSLLTGRNHHSVGMGFLADTDNGFPRGRGRVDPDVDMLPAILHDAGYATYLVGKWHLTPHHEITPAGPFRNWPLARGFERFYGFLDGCTDQRTPELYEDNRPIDPPQIDDYYLSKDLASQAIRMIRDHVTFRPDTPFYLHLAFGAAHAPFQVPREYIDRYIPTFEKGWDRTRDDRLARQIDMGLCPAGTKLTERNPGVLPWAELTEQQRFLYTRLQATYAGFLQYADEQLGRVVDFLREHGQLDNTAIVVLSDNGASAEGGADGAIDTNGPYGGAPEPVEDQVERIAVLGSAQGPAHYPSGWAMASNTPFRRYKQFVDLGGIRSPLILNWAGSRQSSNAVRKQFVHAVDITPTILGLVGVKPGRAFDGADISATFGNADADEVRQIQYFEMFGHRAIRDGDWTAVTEHVPHTAYTEDRWRLYNTSTDFSQCSDVAPQFSGTLARLKDLWEQEAHNNGVFPLDDRTMVEMLKLRSPRGLLGRPRITLLPGQSHVPFASTITGLDRSMRIRAELRSHPAPSDGVIVASGNSTSGYVLYVADGHLTFEYHYLGKRVAVTDMERLTAARHTVGFDTSVQVNGPGLVSLIRDDTRAGELVIPTATAHVSFYGLDIGRDRLSQVSGAYTGEFPMSAARLGSVVFDFIDQPNLAAVSAALESRS